MYKQKYLLLVKRSPGKHRTTAIADPSNTSWKNYQINIVFENLIHFKRKFVTQIAHLQHTETVGISTKSYLKIDA